jgi:hypothetical protein
MLKGVVLSEKCTVLGTQALNGLRHSPVAIFNKHCSKGVGEVKDQWTADIPQAMTAIF